MQVLYAIPAWAFLYYEFDFFAVRSWQSSVISPGNIDRPLLALGFPIKGHHLLAV